MRPLRVKIVTWGREANVEWKKLVCPERCCACHMAGLERVLTFDYAQGAGAWPRAASHDPFLQSLEPFLEAALLRPVAFGNRVGEGERQRVAVVGRGQAAPSHVVLALQQDGVRGVVTVIDRLHVGREERRLADAVARGDGDAHGLAPGRAEMAVEQAVAQFDQDVPLPFLGLALAGERRVRDAPGKANMT